MKMTKWKCALGHVRCLTRSYASNATYDKRVAEITNDLTDNGCSWIENDGDERCSAPCVRVPIKKKITIEFEVDTDDYDDLRVGDADNLFELIEDMIHGDADFSETMTVSCEGETREVKRRY
jgi:hypothetical protein